jgi:uracil-DNA glycosylase family 4
MAMSTAPISLLRQYLEAKRDSGRTHVGISGESMRLLGGLRAKADGRLREAEAAVDAAAPPKRDEVESAMERESEGKRDARVLTVEGATNAAKLARVRELAVAAPEARGLGTLRETMVFAVGNPDAKLMLIGEAPGYQEERQGEPFVGPAGEKLTLILKAMGLGREDVYISNICKFRPAIEEGGDQGTRNRKPTEVEMRSCLPFVLTEIDIIQPQCLVALGATAAEGLGLTGAVGSLRGKRHEVSGIPTVVTYHPSYVLREEKMGDGTRVKRQVWEDMMMAMELLGMPISAKQRGYFRAG